MKLFAALFAVLALFSSSVISENVSKNATDILIDSGSMISTIKWQNVRVGSHVVVEFQGSMEQLLDHVEAKYLGWNRTSLLVSHSDAIEREVYVEPRADGGPQDGPPGHARCCPIPGQPWTIGVADALVEGFNYIRNLGGNIWIDAAGHVDGNKNCGRISCSRRTAIYLCNDNPFPIAPPTTKLTALAQDIYYHCWDSTNIPWRAPWVGLYPSVCGQVFHDGLFNDSPTNYNIFVAWDYC